MDTNLYRKTHRDRKQHSTSSPEIYPKRTGLALYVISPHRKRTSETVFECLSTVIKMRLTKNINIDMLKLT